MPTSLTISSKKSKQVIDITENVQATLTHANKSGLCHVFALHTTAAITTADLDPGTDLDMLDAFNAIVPHLKYRHPHNPAHAPDHIMSSIIGPDTLVPVKDGKLTLGTWQRIVLIELDGPRERDVVVTFLGA